MFSILPVLVPNFRSTPYYAPQVSSPLSSSPGQSSPPSLRDGNALGQPRLPMPSPTPSKTRKENPYSKRVTFSNPLIHNRNDGTEARRKLFLRKVRKDSQDKRWDARGGDDEMMRTIWIAEQRRQTERKAREAMAHGSASLEEELESDARKQMSPELFKSSQDEAMADEVARYEDAEIEAALSNFPAKKDSQPYYPHEGQEIPCCSDDEEYDRIFLEVIEEAERTAEVKADDGVLQEYLNTKGNSDEKHSSEDTNQADLDMMDIT